MFLQNTLNEHYVVFYVVLARCTLYNFERQTISLTRKNHVNSVETNKKAVKHIYIHIQPFIIRFIKWQSTANLQF